MGCSGVGLTRACSPPLSTALRSALAGSGPTPTLCPLHPAQFWSTERPDWYALYSQRQSYAQQAAAAGGDEEAAGGGSGGGGSSGDWKQPPFSATTLLRKWEAAQRELLEARIRKRQRREAWMLQQYGGVKPDTADEAAALLANGGDACSRGGCRSCEAPPGGRQHVHVHA